MLRMGAKASSGGGDFAGHSSFDPDATVGTSTSNIPTNPIAYDGNSGFETDPEIVRSEMMFYSTPITEKYSAAAYGAIRNIQDQCATDFQNVCPTESPYVSFNYLMDQLFAPTQFDFVFRRRKLTDAANHFRNGAEFVEYLRSLHSPRSLPELLHPLSAVMYRNEKTKTYVNPRAEKVQSAPGKLSAKPRSYATAATAVGGAGGHHVRVGDTHRHRQRRRLRNVMDAPRPCGAAASGWDGSEDGSADGFQQEAEGEEVAAPQPPLDFSRLVLDFLNGRDITLFLDSRSGSLMPVGSVAPATAQYLSFAPVFSVSLRDDDAGDDAGDDGAYYYAEDDDDGEAWAEDDGYYAYEDDDGNNAYNYYDDASATILDGGEDDFYSPGPASSLSASLYKKGGATLSASSPCATELLVGDAGGDGSEDDFYSPGAAHSYTKALYANKASTPGPAAVPVIPAATFAATNLAQMSPPPLLGAPHPLLRGWGVQGDAGHEEGDGPDASRHDHDHDRDHHDHDHRDHDHRDHDHHDHDHHKRGGDSSSSSEEHEGDHPHHPPGPPPPPDHSFSGSLGYGAEGDSCLYRGIAQGRVSDPCIGAVADLYELRAQYWEESQAPPAHHCRGMLLVLALLGGALLGCLFRRWRTRKHRKNVRSLLTALHTHPALKASIESETGLTVPLPHPEPACCLSPQQGQADRCTGSRVARACKVLAAFAGLLVVSFVVSVTSLHITQHLVRYLDEHAPPDPVTGDPQYTSVPAALLILLMVCTAQITLITLAVRSLRACCSADKSGDDSHSAPPSTTDGATSTSSPTAPRAVQVTEGAALWLQRHLQRLSSRFGRTQAGSAHDGYTMLPGGDEYAGEGDLMLGQAGAPGGTEMVTFTAARPSAPPVMVAQQVQHQQQYQLPQQQRYAAVLVPVTAMPVNTVSMV